jgi:hypothetical protein
VARPQPTTAEWTIIAGAAATFLGSFLDAAGGATAWGTASFSVIKLVPIYAIAVGGVVAARRYLGADLPERVGPFTWPQLLVVVAGFGTVMAVAWLITLDQRGVGLWVMFAGSLVMTAGTVVEARATQRRLHLYSPPLPRKEHLSSGNLVIVGAGAVMILGSFLPFWKINVPAELGADVSYTAWSRVNFFPVTIIPVLCAAVMIAGVALRAVLHLARPNRLFGFTWDQVYFACAAQAAFLMLAFTIEGHPGFQLGTGFYLMLAAAFALVVGAVMRTREGSTAY